MKINANDQLDLNGLCTRGCENKTSINTYQLFMLNSSSSQWIPFTGNFYYFYTGLASSQTDLTVKEELFQDYSHISVWKVELNVFNPSENTSGSAAVHFLVNFPPKNGSCDINLKNRSTDSLFSIVCSNWFDSDGKLDSFSYYGYFTLLYLKGFLK
jgi:hypothetical protein